MSYIFGGNTGMTYADLVKARQQQEMYRRQQEAARSNIGAPTTFGGGLNAVGGAIASIISGRKANKLGKETDAAEKKRRSAAQELLVRSLTGGGNVPPSGGRGPESGGNAYRDAIASIESAGSGDYSAVGPTNSRLGRALGRYQIMEANIAPWSKEALGREVTPDEFLQNPEIQDAIFDHKFNGYVEKFGPEGAAQAWFAGPGGVGKTDRQDVLGTSVGEYTQKFNNALGGTASTRGAPQQPQPQRLPPNNQVASNGPDPRQIMQFMASDEFKFLDPQQQAMVAQQYQMAQQANDPMRQMQMEKAQIELNALRNPAAAERKILEDRNGVSRYVDTGEPVFQNVGNPPPDPEAAADLRKEFGGIQAVKDFSKQSQAWGRIIASTENPSPAGDLALIFNYMKLLDPGSVVRESEFELAASSGSYGTRIQTMVNKALSGERLTPDIRNDFLKRAEKLYDSAQRGNNSIYSQYEGIANEQGMNPSSALTDYSYQGTGATHSQTRPQARQFTQPSAAQPGAMPSQKGAQGWSGPSAQQIQNMTPMQIQSMLSAYDVRGIPDDVLEAIERGMQ